MNNTMNEHLLVIRLHQTFVYRFSNAPLEQGTAEFPDTLVTTDTQEVYGFRANFTAFLQTVSRLRVQVAVKVIAESTHPEVVAAVRGHLPSSETVRVDIVETPTPITSLAALQCCADNFASVLLLDADDRHWRTDRQALNVRHVTIPEMSVRSLDSADKAVHYIQRFFLRQVGVVHRVNLSTQHVLAYMFDRNIVHRHSFPNGLWSDAVVSALPPAIRAVTKFEATKKRARQ